MAKSATALRLGVAILGVVAVSACSATFRNHGYVPSDQEIEISLMPREGINAAVSVDGRRLCDLDVGDRLRISKSDYQISLVHPPGYDYYDILRSKLHWGRDSRDQNSGDKG